MLLNVRRRWQAKYGPEKFTVIAFPCNQFGAQEPVRRPPLRRPRPPCRVSSTPSPARQRHVGIRRSGSRASSVNARKEGGERGRRIAAQEEACTGCRPREATGTGRGDKTQKWRQNHGRGQECQGRGGDVDSQGETQGQRQTPRQIEAGT